MSGYKAKGKANNAAAQNSVAERRLRPIYECLDYGKYKKVLQEADKVLRKQPDFQCCKVLKALALVRMGREEEAQPILDGVLSESPTDDGTLQGMTMAFKELQQPDKICTIYENATKKEPTEEFLSHLFMSYVRVGDFKKQQHAAMSLYKAWPKNPYYFWAVMSVVLQATCGNVDEKLAVNVTLPLAERMIEKMVKDQKIDQEQEMHLYLMVLELQSKWQQALDVIEGPLGQKLDEQTSYLNLLKTKKLDYLRKLGKWDQVNKLTKDRLKEEPDQWNVYVEYLNSVFQIADGNFNVEDDDGVDKTVGDAVSFIAAQKRDNGKCRGPFLAHMELVSRLVARRDPGTSEEELVDLLFEHFKLFGAKPVCGQDLKLFIQHLQGDQLLKLFEKMEGEVEMNDGIPCSLVNVQKHVCTVQMRRLMGFYSNEGDKLADEFVSLYKSSLPFVNDHSELETTPNDEYAVMAGLVLWDLWNESGDNKYFWKAVVFLQCAVKISPANFSLRFLLIKFFNRSGAVGCSLSIHSGLDLKQIQLESLGHLVSRHITTCGYEKDQQSNSNLIARTLSFYTGSYRDIIDHIMSAYRFGSFDKIREFIRFRDRISNSQLYSILTVDRMLLDLLNPSKNHATAVQMMSYLEVDPTKDDIQWSELTDNRDFTAMPCWEPLNRAWTDETVADSFVEEQQFLKFRSLILRSTAAAIYLSEDIHPAVMAALSAKSSKDVVNGHDQASLSDAERGQLLYPVLEQLVRSLREHKSKVKICDGKKCPSVQGPDSKSRLEIYLEGNYFELMVSLLDYVLKAYSNASSGEKFEMDAEVVCKEVELMVKKVKEIVDAQPSKILGRDFVIEHIINSLETCAFAAIFCGVVRTLLTSKGNLDPKFPPNSSVSSVGKGKKKKANTSHQNSNASDINPEMAISFTTIVTTFTQAIQDLIAISDDLYKVTVLDRLDEALVGDFSSMKLGNEVQEVTEITRDEQQRQHRKSELMNATTMETMHQEIAKQMSDSYECSFVHIGTVFRIKESYFSSLKM